MALPDVTTTTITFGPYTDAEGLAALVAKGGKLFAVDPSTNRRIRLTHIASGQVIVPEPVDITIGEDGTGSVGPIPHTGQASISPVGYAWRVEWNIATGPHYPSPGNLTFVVDSGVTADFDLLVPAETVPAVEISQPTVASVNGQTGAVSLDAADVGAVTEAGVAADIGTAGTTIGDAAMAAYGRVENIVGHGADPTGAADSRAAIVVAIAAAEISGAPVFVPEGTFIKDGAAIPVPSGVTVIGAGATSIIKNGATPTAPIFTNSDTVAGNTGIRLLNMKLDANRAAASSGAFHVVYMNNLTGCEFDGLTLTGGRNDGVTAGSGSGLCIERMTRSRIGHIYAHDTDYDGVLLGGCTYNVIESVHGVDCARNALQLSRYPLGVGTTPSQFNTVGTVVAEHSTGIPSGTSPVTGAVYFHNALYNEVGRVIAYGTRTSVGGIGTDGGVAAGNVIGSVIAQTRYVDRAAIDWEPGCSRNQVLGGILRPLSGASGIYYRVNASGFYNIARGLHAFIGGGTGTWTVSFSGAAATDNDLEIIDAAGAPSISDTGARNLVRYTNAGGVFIKKTGASVVTVA